MKHIFGMILTLSYLFGNVLYAQNLLPVKDHATRMYGYKYDGSEKWVVKPRYSYVGDFHDGLAYIIEHKGVHKDKHGDVICKKYRAGYINEKGKIVIPMKFEWANDFHDGLAVVKVWDDTSIFHWRFGYIDTAGNFAILPIYDAAEPFYNGKAQVRWYDEYGFCWETVIDREGREGEKRQVGNSRIRNGQTKPKWR